MTLLNEIERPADSTCGKSTRVIEPGNPELWNQLNHSPFIFRHNLVNSPLFDIDRLLRLASKALDRGDAARFSIMIRGDEKFSAAPLRERLLQAASLIEKGAVWFKLTNLQELDQEYQRLLEKVISETEDLAGLSVRRDICYSGMTVFVASPNMVTPYHIDHDTNFLFQLRGEKTVRLFDPQNRHILTENEIEQFYGGNAMAAKFREEILDSGRLFHLVPGTAVHHPPLAPHIVTNANNVSLSVGFWFTFPNDVKKARIYQANYALRYLGLEPSPPGRSMLRDRLKSALVELASPSNPSSHEKMLFSVMDRLRAVMKLPKRLLRKPQNA